MGAGLASLAGGCATSGADGPSVPVIRMEPGPAIPADGGLCEIRYTIEPAADGLTVTAACEQMWLHDFDTSQAGRVLFLADPNPDTQPRSAVVTLACAGAEAVQTTATQAGGAEQLFTITCTDPATSRITVEWVPAEGVGAYFSLVTEKAYFDRFPDDESYMADDMEYIRKRAELYEMTFEQMLAQYLTTGTRRSRIEGLKPGTEYYAYAYGMTPLGEPTTGIVKSLFRTEAVGRVNCTFAFDVASVTPFRAETAVVPSDKTCTYFWDCVDRAAFDAFGTPDQVIATNIRYIREAVEIWQMAGYDYAFADFLSTGDDRSAQNELTPDAEYVLFAFGLDESGVATTDLATGTFRTEPFTPTDACTFTLAFGEVTATRMQVEVVPSNPATRYYVGICEASNLDRFTPDELAGQFIAQENRNDLDWGGSRYLFTGTRAVDTAADLDLEDLAADTEYAAVVFGVDTEGVRTTVVACARQRTRKVPQSAMTIAVTVTNITPFGAVAVFRPSVENETYFTDCIDYATYAGFGGDEEAFVRSIVGKLGSQIGSYLTSGYHRLDAEGMLRPETEYMAYAFGYSGGVTTPLMKSERFVTRPLVTGSPAGVTLRTEIRDGDEFYAADPIRYAAYKGRAVVYARLEPNQHALHWYCGAFKDISEYDDRTMIGVLKAQGKEDARELGNLAEWGSSLTYAAVATDAQGAYGSVLRTTVRVDRSAIAAAEAPTMIPAGLPCEREAMVVRTSRDGWEVNRREAVFAPPAPCFYQVRERMGLKRAVGTCASSAGPGRRLSAWEHSAARRPHQVRFR